MNMVDFTQSTWWFSRVMLAYPLKNVIYPGYGGFYPMNMVIFHSYVAICQRRNLPSEAFRRWPRPAFPFASSVLHSALQPLFIGAAPGLTRWVEGSKGDPMAELWRLVDLLKLMDDFLMMFAVGLIFFHDFVDELYKWGLKRFKTTISEENCIYSIVRTSIMKIEQLSLALQMSVHPIRIQQI